MNDLFDLTGRTALVTGASRGIGQAIAIALARAGADLVLVSRSPATPTEEALHEFGTAVQSAQIDLRDAGALESFAGDLVETRRIDILVNNAGDIIREDSTSVTDSQWADTLSLNLDAPFILSRRIGAQMLEHGRGRIINIASMLSFQGGVRTTAYAASKHAIVGMTKALSNEWAGRGVCVNAIAPGYVTSANTEEIRADERRYKEITGRIPVGRWADPSDLAGAAIFLASDAASYVTGHVLAVDGGWLGR